MQSSSNRAGTTGMQSSLNQGQHSGNCTQTLLLDAMDQNFLWAKRIFKHKVPVAARCTLMVEMVYISATKPVF